MNYEKGDLQTSSKFQIYTEPNIRHEMMKRVKSDKQNNRRKSIFIEI